MRAIVAMCLMPLALQARAATYYVSTAGSDSNPGTISLPFRSIQRGVNAAANPGDIVYLRGGVYQQGDPRVGSSQILIRNSGTAAAPITLASYPGEKAVIKYTWVDEASWDTQVYGRIAFTAWGGDKVPVGYWVIDGLELDNTGINFFSGRNITVKNVYCHDAGICFGGNIYQCTFDGNIIDFTRSHGMYVSGTQNVFTNNRVTRTGLAPNGSPSGGYGFQLAGYPVGTTYAGPEYYTFQNNSISNNTFAYNRWSGIVSWQPDAKNNTYTNNIFYENGVQSSGAQGITWMSSGGGNILRNNLFYATAPGATADFASSTPQAVSFTESGSIRGADPMFVNGPASYPAGGPDLHLRSGSPAIGKGLTVAESAYDMDHQARSVPYDIGADEFLSGTPTVNAVPAPPKNAMLR